MPTSSYTAIFYDYLRGGLTQMLTLVRAAVPLPSEQERQQAWHLLTCAFTCNEMWPLTRALLLALAPQMEQAGFREEWLRYLEQGLQQSQAVGDVATTAELQLAIGLLQRLQSEFVAAQNSLTASAAGFAASTDAQGQARAYNELAYLAFLQHHYTEADTYVQYAIALVAEDDVAQAMSYRVKGMLAIGRQQWQAAEVYHRKALGLFEKAQDQRKMAWSLQNIGYALRGQQKYTAAIAYLEQAAALLRELQDIFHWAIVQMNIGIAYMSNGQPHAAQPYYVRAETTFRQIYSTQFLAKVYINLGLNYLALEDLSAAARAFTNSIALFAQLGDESERLNALDGLAIVYLAQKQFAQALHLLQPAVAQLSHITDKPTYPYLRTSLSRHLAEAQKGKEDAELASSF